MVCVEQRKGEEEEEEDEEDEEEEYKEEDEEDEEEEYAAARKRYYVTKQAKMKAKQEQRRVEAEQHRAFEAQKSELQKDVEQELATSIWPEGTMTIVKDILEYDDWALELVAQLMNTLDNIGVEKAELLSGIIKQFNACGSIPSNLRSSGISTPAEALQRNDTDS